ncbi:hypothetical protein SISNIDRAFT_484489 [Sistotremastrum niveocremeum HHB9708]|uniref:F-box domain-containing protein n=1 Tax=Sistotremastrum niveocremeum HHB9708 TaxID=1314777 RepID=A0A164WEA3_9AGAM|nr:hypothetical protein SISNIDRAFT_484489 [Sistotremastrum niveocremeum HHB9708]
MEPPAFALNFDEAPFPGLAVIEPRRISLRSIIPTSGSLTQIHAWSWDLKLLEIIDLLAASPLLEVVTLEHQSSEHIPRWDEADEIAAAQFHPVRALHNIRRFELRWCGAAFADTILQKLTFPASSSVKFSIARTEEDIEVLESLPNSLSEVLDSAVNLIVNIESFRMATDGPFILSFKSLQSPSYTVRFNEPGDRSMLDPEHVEQIYYNQITGILSDLAEMSFGHLKDVRISLRHFTDSLVMFYLLRAFQKVEHLTIRCFSASRVIQALRSNERSDTHGYPCPALRTLDIRNSEFDPVQLEKTLINRNEWTDSLQCLQVTVAQRLFTGKVGPEAEGKPMDHFLRNISQLVDNYEGEDGDWTDTSEDTDEEGSEAEELDEE